MAIALAMLALAAGGFAGCTPGAKVEGRLAGEWLPAVVAEDRGDQCIVKLKYAGVEQTVYLDPKDFRSAPSAPAVAQRADAVRGHSATAPGIVATTPEQIYADFDRDGPAATAKYVDRRIRIAGAAHRIQDGRISFFRLGYDLVATCDFADAARPQLARLRPDQPVTVTGYVDDRVTHHVIRLSACTLDAVEASRPAPAIPVRPPLGIYQCFTAGRPNGPLTLASGSYTVSGVTGGYRFDPRSRRFAWTGGNFAKWGWSGTWEAGPPRPDGVVDPRIVLRGGPPPVAVSCFPPK